MAETTMVNGHPFCTYSVEEVSAEEMLIKAKKMFERMNTRRSVRDFDSKPVPLQVMHQLIATAASAPSGANKQPWTFCLISDPKLKKQIRELAEEEERKSYAGRMSDRWLKDLEPLGTDPNKPFLEEAPYLIVIFKRVYESDTKDVKYNNYYVNESVGIAVGFLLAAIQNAGLVALTHTPSPMGFLQKALNRPENERAFLLMPVGYLKKDALVPDISRKSPSEYLVEYH